MKKGQTLKRLFVGMALASGVLFSIPSIENAEASFKPPVYETLEDGNIWATFVTLDELKKIAVDLYNTPKYDGKDFVYFTETNTNDEFINYFAYSADISEKIPGYSRYGRVIQSNSVELMEGVYRVTISINNEREDGRYVSQADWKKKMDASEKYIVENYKLVTDYDVVYAINHFIGEQLEYGVFFSKDHPFLEARPNSTSCTGYTDVAAELYKRFGIKNRYVSGMVSAGPHTWNAVYIGNQWYYTDATFADTSRNLEKNIMMTEKDRKQDYTQADTKFRASDKKWDMSMASPYDYKAVKKLQSLKK